MFGSSTNEILEMIGERLKREFGAETDQASQHIEGSLERLRQANFSTGCSGLS
jgi:hypothetical protein